MSIAGADVVAELMRKQPHPHVLAWASGLAENEVTRCVVTVEEIERGLGRLAGATAR